MRRFEDGRVSDFVALFDLLSVPQPGAVEFTKPASSVNCSLNACMSCTFQARIRFAITSHTVIAGDRVVVILDVGPLVFENGRPKSTYRLLSLDLNSGVVRNQQDVTDYRMPDLYATDDDHRDYG